MTEYIVNWKANFFAGNYLQGLSLRPVRKNLVKLEGVFSCYVEHLMVLVGSVFLTGCAREGLCNTGLD